MVFGLRALKKGDKEKLRSDDRVLGLHALWYTTVRRLRTRLGVCGITITISVHF